MPDGVRPPAPATDADGNEALTRGEWWLLLGITIAWAGFLLYLGLAARLPIVGDVDSSEFAWWGHAIGTMLFTALVYLLVLGRGGRTRRQTALLALVIGIAGGALLEVLQAIGGSRDPTIVDVVVDAAGAIVAVAVLSSARVSRRAAMRILSVSSAAMLVIGVPVVIFATPTDSSHACDLQPIAASDHGKRVGSAAGPAPVAAYTFDEGSGRTVADAAGGSLTLELTGRTSWIEGGGVRFARGAARSESSATNVVQAVRDSGKVTIMARARSARLDQNGPTRIVTISSGPDVGQVDVHLGQEGRSLSVRLRATCGAFTGKTIPDVFTSTRHPVDVAVTFSEGIERVYVDGAPVAAWRLHGTLRNWQPLFPLVVGNEATGDRPFVGDVFGVLVYDRALTGAAIAEQTAAWQT